MSPTTDSSRFFGIDLHALWLELRRPWQGMHQWPVFAWLTPDLPVRVLRADGREIVWLGGRRGSAVKVKGEPFEAIELPDDLFLRRTLTMPAMPQAQIIQAVALDVRSASPFVPADLVWGYTAQSAAQGGLRIDVVFASLKQATQYVDAQKHRLVTTAVPELWAFTPAGAPVVLTGWGEARRTRYAAMRRRLAYALVLGALCLVAAIVVTPTMQLRLRSIQATRAYEAAQSRTGALLSQREAFVRSTEKLESLRGVLADIADPMPLLEILTQTLPDDTSLQSLQVKGLKVTINGLTTNAATLMQLLGATKGFKEVRAPSPATRNPGATAENFIIEFQLDPAVLSMAATASVAGIPAVPASAEGVSVPAVGSVAPTSAPASAPAAPMAPAPSANPPRKSRFSSGGEGPAVVPAPKESPAATSAVRKAGP